MFRLYRVTKSASYLCTIVACLGLKEFLCIFSVSPFFTSGIRRNHVLLFSTPRYDGVVWATIIAQGIGGLLVALVLKYADNVVKSFATAMAILLSMFLDAMYFHMALPLQAQIGAAMVVTAMVAYTRQS